MGPSRSKSVDSSRSSGSSISSKHSTSSGELPLPARDMPDSDSFSCCSSSSGELPLPVDYEPSDSSGELPLPADLYDMLSQDGGIPDTLSDKSGGSAKSDKNEVEDNAPKVNSGQGSGKIEKVYATYRGGG